MTKLIADPARVEELASFLLAESRLPGPRANLELAGDIALVTNELADKSGLLPTYRDWLSEDKIDHPAAEYLPFCALNGLGGLYLGASSSDRGEIEELLREAANSENWRLREAVTLALQFIGERDAEAMMEILHGWSVNPTLLETRAIVATVAHPPILRTHPVIAQAGLELFDKAFHSVHTTSPAERNLEFFKVLAKGLGFAVSVIVAEAPESGFALLRRWAATGDVDIDKILMSNLKKDRLVRRFPVETSQVASLLNGDRR